MPPSTSGPVSSRRRKRSIDGSCRKTPTRRRPGTSWASLPTGPARRQPLSIVSIAPRAAAPANAGYCSNRGAVLQGLGRLTEAEAEFREALRLNPNQAEAHNNLGNVLRDLGRYEESGTCYRRALELQPDFPEAHNNLGNVLRDLGRLEEAVGVLPARARAEARCIAEAHHNLGNVLRDLGRLHESLPAIDGPWSCGRTIPKPTPTSRPCCCW